MCNQSMPTFTMTGQGSFVSIVIVPPHRLTNFLFPDPEAYRGMLSNLRTLHANHPEIHTFNQLKWR